MHNHGSTPIALHGFSDAALNGAAAVDAGTDADMSSEIRDRLASLRATASRSAAGVSATGGRVSPTSPLSARFLLLFENSLKPDAYKAQP